MTTFPDYPVKGESFTEELDEMYVTWTYNDSPQDQWTQVRVMKDDVVFTDQVIERGSGVAQTTINPGVSCHSIRIRSRTSMRSRALSPKELGSSTVARYLRTMFLLRTSSGCQTRKICGRRSSAKRSLFASMRWVTRTSRPRIVLCWALLRLATS